jgi:SecD/SecF fusion protein
MQLKGAIRLFAIVLFLVCAYQLWFTAETYFTEKNAEKYAQSFIEKLKQNPDSSLALKKEAYFDSVFNRKKTYYLDSVANEPVYNFLWLKKYTYREVKEREINRGLDLKGGMNVVLEVSVEDLIRSLSNFNNDTLFNKALALARERYKNSQSDFITLFGQAFSELDPNAKLSSIFNTVELREKINYNSSNEEVLKIIRQEADKAINNAFEVIRTRIDHFGVVQPRVQRLENTGRILVELPGVREPERVRKLLQGTASLEFWETYENKEIYPYLLQANQKIKEIEEAKKKIQDEATQKTKTKTLKDNKVVKEEKSEKETSLIEKIAADTTKKADSTEKSVDQWMKEYPLFALLRPHTNSQGALLDGSEIGFAHYRDSAKINEYLNMPQVRSLFPRDVKFLWEVKGIKDPRTGKFSDFIYLHAIKVTSRDGRPPLDGSVVVNARAGYSQNKSNSEVDMAMNTEGAKIWAKLTKDNINRRIAIVLDNYVYSAPVVNSEIRGGRSQITGSFTPNEAKDLANVLESGKLPAPAKIVQEAIVGPSLGKEAVRSGFLSFIIAFLIVLLYMAFYYNRAGLVANIALAVNAFFIIGILASLQAVLTLPGIAGIVLTLGMAVDANVVIYERIREELNAGKGLKLAIADGFKYSYSAILDSNITTILTGIILYIFGTGPIRGFATTLIIGICTSLFTAIFISRLIFEWMLDKNYKINFGNFITNNAFKKVNINFLGLRKYLYAFSIILTTVGISSMVIRGLNPGVDFTGGRNYIVKFDRNVKVDDVKKLLQQEFGEVPAVITYGQDNQVRITTKYRIQENDTAVDREIETKLFSALKPLLPSDITLSKFLDEYRVSSQKIGPTIASDIKRSAFLAVIFAIILMFIYIAIRFKNWQFGLGAVASLVHDTIIVLGAFSLFHGRLSFPLEASQELIAAVLTVIGYSVNDTVIIFDRVREYIGKFPKRDRKEIMNLAMNSTISRTINTSFTTLIVLVAIFLFGGEVIQGLVFALLIGIFTGTYSSVFIAVPIAYDTLKKDKVSAVIRK